MSHIPASAMPHAAPKHSDGDAPMNGEATAPEPAASAPLTPRPIAKPKRSGLAKAALAIGGIALAAGAFAFAIPTLRRAEDEAPPKHEPKRKGRKGKR